MTQAYIYHWQELSTNKWYIGSRTRKGCHPNDGYICSSKTVKPLIQSNPANWRRTIIAVGDPNDIFNFEITILKALDAKNDLMSYNQSNGDQNFTVKGKLRSQEHSRKISQASTGISRNKGKVFSDEHRRKLSEARKRRVVTEETKRKISEGRKGFKYTEETKRKIRETNKGQKRSEETCRKIGLSKMGPLNWQYGKIPLYKTIPRSEETKRKISEGRKGFKHTEETKRKIRETKNRKK